jgi:adenylosuccinate synthase
MGREFGATTGRARRCGWFDAVATRYARIVNGIDELAITNLDGLDTLKEIQICVAYECRGKRIAFPPNDADELLHCRPIYRKFAGWQKDTSGVRHFKKLPPSARSASRHFRSRFRSAGPICLPMTIVLEAQAFVS